MKKNRKLPEDGEMRFYKVPVLAGVLLDIWLGIVKQGGKRMHHYLLSMRKLLEKYYNINYYCTYKLLFFIFWRMLNPFYWLASRNGTTAT